MQYNKDKQRWWWVGIAGLLTVVAITYSQMITHSLVWDDPNFILEWQTPKKIEQWSKFFSGDNPWQHVGVYRPFRGFFYGVSWWLFKGEPMGYQIQAVLIHLSCTLLVVLLTAVLWEKQDVSCILAGLIFGLHPVAVEAVAWITASFDTIGIIAMLLSIISYVKWVKKEEQIKVNRWLVLSVVTAVVAYGVYEMTLVLPLLLVLIDKVLGLKAKLKRYWPYIIFNLLYWVIRLLILHIVSRQSYPFGNILNTLLVTIGFGGRYIKLFIYPDKLGVNHWLANNVTGLFSADYNPYTATSLTSLYGWSVITGLLLILFFWIGKRKKFYEGVFGGGWLVISLIPVMQIFPQGTIFAEKYLYIGLVGLSILVAKTVILVGRKWFYAVIIIWLLWLSFQTRDRISNYQNNKSLWSAAVTSNPKSSVVYTNLGHALFVEGDLDKAVKYTNKAIELNPNAAVNYANLGIIAHKKGEVETAIKYYQQALSYNQYHYSSLLYLGVAYYQQERYPQAADTLNLAKNECLVCAEVYYYLGMVYHQQHQYAGALKNYQLAIDLKPDFADAYNNLGNYYSDTGEKAKAKEAYKKCLMIEPTHPYAKDNLNREQKGD